MAEELNAIAPNGVLGPDVKFLGSERKFCCQVSNATSNLVKSIIPTGTLLASRIDERIALIRMNPPNSLYCFVP